MIRRHPKAWESSLTTALQQLLARPPLRFSQMTPSSSSLPEAAGVYLITKIEGNTEIPCYVGRTKNISQRLYNNHLMGPVVSAPLKKYLINNKICSTIEEAKNFLLENCAARWLEKDDYRVRGAIESYCTAMLFPEYGIAEEH